MSLKFNNNEPYPTKPKTQPQKAQSPLCFVLCEEILNPNQQWENPIINETKLVKQITPTSQNENDLQDLKEILDKSDEA